MDYIKTGKLVAVHGLKGELTLKHHLGKKTALPNLQAIFIEDRKESFLPWFVESAKAKSDTELYLKLKEVDTREAAQKLVGKDLWLRQEDFGKYAAAASPVNLLGYMLIEDKKELGPIEEVIEQPQQLLCRTVINGKDAFIPLHEQTLQKIDRKAKQVWVQLPEGLLEIYR